MAFDPATRIAAERDATQDFIHLLQREQGILQEKDVSELLALSREKGSQAQRLVELASERNRWIESLGCSHDHAGMERALQGCPEAAQAWSQLLQLAQAASELNKINGILVNQRLRYNTQALAALQGPVQSAGLSGLYGSDGQPRLFKGGRRLGEV
ncbi:MAG: flagellar biosynthesis protein FlgN [Nitrosospira sp. 56-18]|jgi:flagella synthesis protein FlgN|nr:flagellar protein FlgN [Nitrosospira sp.]OJY15404.1 MAG: flagellar biosynthesis protein FlgN [Nitrosospira sp. 56-18]